MSAGRPRLGMTAEPADTELMVSEFPDILYMRDFGRKDASGRSGALLTPPGTGKWLHLPPDAIMHASWKGNIEDLGPYLDLLYRPTLFSYWHEPMDDVAAGRLTTAEFRQRGTRGAQIIAEHPNRHLVLGWGPVLTRWWLEHGGNPDEYWFDGATFFAADTYNGRGATSYRTPEETLGVIASTAARYGVPWLAPELGAELVPDDDGTGRAEWMRANARLADEEGNCLAIGWWGLGGNRVIGHPIETAAWRELTAAQKGYTMADWRVAYGLNKLLAQINEIAPNRNKASDGSIGDPAHQDRPSDHNPDAQGIVRARDFTHDPAAGANMGEISEALRVSRDRRIKYVIFNRRIFSATVEPWVWRPYTGTNPHDKHMHVSTVADNAIADDTSDWSITVALTNDDVSRIRAAVLGREWSIAGRTLAGSVEALIAYGQRDAALFADVLTAIDADPGNPIELTPEQIATLAELLAARMPAAPTAAENAAAVVAEIAS